MTDEHGRPDPGYVHEHGPEWWAMGAEFCECSHHVDGHLLENLGTPQYVAGRCLAPGCDCLEFRAATP